MNTYRVAILRILREVPLRLGGRIAARWGELRVISE
jgi:hypothetical protein